jgi:hypothetical protein
LGLRQPVRRAFQFLGMRDFFARRERDERQEAGINPYEARSTMA